MISQVCPYVGNDDVDSIEEKASLGDALQYLCERNTSVLYKFDTRKSLFATRWIILKTADEQSGIKHVLWWVPGGILEPT